MCFLLLIKTFSLCENKPEKVLMHIRHHVKALQHIKIGVASSAGYSRHMMIMSHF